MKKYFLFSDTHGVNPSIVQKTLLNKGFDFDNPDHIPVIAGDLCDGLGSDNELLDFLRSMENLIAVKGNHDLGTTKVHYWHDTNFKDSLSVINKQFLSKLPFQLNTEDFLLAHGMYIEDSYPSLEQDSIWASPILLGLSPDFWWRVDPDVVSSLNTQFDNSLSSYEQSLSKPLFLGHFDSHAINKYIATADHPPTINSQGFYQCGKIVWLDKGIRRDLTEFDIFVFTPSSE